MTAGSNPHKPLRILVLSRELPFDAQALRQWGQRGAICLRASNAYEAAAELLCAPAVALVMDLQNVNGHHVRLLDFARQMGVEMLATGSPPAGMTAEDFSGVRLIARRDLPAAVQRILDVNVAVEVSPVPELPVSQEPQEEILEELPESDEYALADEMLEKAVRKADEPRTPKARDVGEYIVEPPAEPSARPQTPPRVAGVEAAGASSPAEKPQSQGGILTPEEIAALLGGRKP
jgi:hypothetical protein